MFLLDSTGPEQALGFLAGLKDRRREKDGCVGEESVVRGRLCVLGSLSLLLVWLTSSNRPVLCYSTDSEWWEGLYCTPPFGVKTDLELKSQLKIKAPDGPRPWELLTLHVNDHPELCPDCNLPGPYTSAPARWPNLYSSQKHLGIKWKCSSGGRGPEVLLPWSWQTWHFKRDRIRLCATYPVRDLSFSPRFILLFM